MIKPGSIVLLAVICLFTACLSAHPFPEIYSNLNSLQQKKDVAQVIGLLRIPVSNIEFIDSPAKNKTAIQLSSGSQLVVVRPVEDRGSSKPFYETEPSRLLVYFMKSGTGMDDLANVDSEKIKDSIYLFELNPLTLDREDSFRLFHKRQLLGDGSGFESGFGSGFEPSYNMSTTALSPGSDDEACESVINWKVYGSLVAVTVYLTGWGLYAMHAGARYCSGQHEPSGPISAHLVVSGVLTVCTNLIVELALYHFKGVHE